MIRAIFCIILFNLTHCFAQIPEADFDQSMGSSCHEISKLYNANPESTSRYGLFKEIYKSNLPSKIKPSKNTKIPKIIHQIWLGGKELPPLYLRYQQEWQAMYPDFEYRLWTEKEIAELDFDYRDLYNDQRSHNFAEKADILRYVILDKFGGIYADFDVEPILNFTELLYQYDFISGLEPPSKKYKINPIINNGFIASSPGNLILEETLAIIRSNFDHYDDFSTMYNPVVARTMLPLTEAFLKEYPKLDHAIILPVIYTQPKQLRSSLSSGYLKKFYRKLFDNCTGVGFTEFGKETILFHNILKE